MKNHKKILITGSNGFVGRALYDELKELGYNLTGSVRNSSKFIKGQANIVVGSINGETSWEEALHDCNVVIHLAGMAHILNDKSGKRIDEFNIINTAGTINLAKQAVNKGVERFIFISSIAVNGSQSGKKPITEKTATNPQTPYARSKLEAEKALLQISSQNKMEVVIVRPPAIYGKNAPGNFGLIETFIRRGIPLPFGSINNKRSLIYIHNFLSFLAICIEHKNVAEKVFVINDNNDLSTAEIILLIATISKNKAKIIKFPKIILSFFFKAIGKNKVRESLLENFQIDSSVSRKLTGWYPAFNPRELFLKSYITKNTKRNL